MLRWSPITALALVVVLPGCFEGLGTLPSGTGGSGGTGGAHTGGAGGTGGDAGSACTPGALQACYTGPPGTQDVGLCRAGVQVCDESGTLSGPCVGQVVPQMESCLTPFDDNCDGHVNEGGDGCVCVPKAMEDCYTGPAGTLGVGACVSGTRTCNDQGTAWGPCEDDITPQPESCNDLIDNDCNGEVNEDGQGCVCTPGASVSCYSGPTGTAGVGACKAGKKTCNAQGNAYGPCTGEVTPQPETCLTAVDDDCNGQVNEGGPGCVCVPGSTASCYSGPAGTAGVGICKAGTQTCNALGTGYGPCAGEVLPVPETCNTPEDDDCNGVANDTGLGCVCPPNAIVPCYSGPPGTAGVGICQAGTQTCNALGTVLGACTGEVLPQAENCFNGTDDNCDGQTNELCTCNPGDVVTCYTGPAGTMNVGVCAPGTRSCDTTTLTYGPCVGDVTPQPETCLDLIDNNCDGQINEGGIGCVCTPNATTSCYSGPAGTAGVGICQAGTHTCDAQGTAYGPCVGEVLPDVETCLDLVDNDCNGQVNEGGPGCVCVPGSILSCYAGPAGTAGVGACKAGAQTCNAQGTAYGPCVGEVVPQPETCLTAVDDDCNGQVNEGGPGCVCTPNSTQVCYTGPTGTLGVGACKSGVSTCNGLGTAWGPCAGEITPQPEDCSTPADENCDGQTPPCPGALQWARVYGSLVDDEGICTTVDASDNVLLGGYMNGTVDFGCGPISAGATDGALLVKLTPDGTCLFSKRWGLSTNVNSVATDAQGNIFIVGTYQNTSLDFGFGALPYVGSGDIYIAKLDPNGNVLWAKGFGDISGQSATGVATDPSGNVFMYGYYAGTVNFGGGPLTVAGGTDLYLAKFNTNGTHLWSKRFGDTAGQTAKGVTTDLQGNVIITGNVAGSVDFGGGALTSAGLNDIFVAKLSPTGAHVWSKRYGDSADQNGTSVRADAQGNILFTGYFNGVIDLGGGPITSLGGADVFVGKLDPAGNFLWGFGKGGTGNQSSLSVGVDPAGNFAITGVLTGTADFGGGPLTNVGGGDVYVAKYDASGAHAWSKRFGDPAAQGAKWITMDSAGNVIVTGILFGPTDFGGGPIPLTGGEDMFLVKLGP